MVHPRFSLIDVEWDPQTARLLERACAAIGRLDSRVSASSVRLQWQLRATWSGFASALRLQGIDIDEIDVFSWACGLRPTGRTSRVTLLDNFEALQPWIARFASNRTLHWRETLGHPVIVRSDHDHSPTLVRATDIIDQLARQSETLSPWLEAPLLLQRFKFTRDCLPCLVIGDRASRSGVGARTRIVGRCLRAFAEAAEQGLATLESLEADRSRAARILGELRRPAPLLKALATLQHTPIVTPKMIEVAHGISLSGAGKLLARAAELGLLYEVSGRGTWKRYLAPDLALRFGFALARRGRPPSPAPSTAINQGFDELLAAFDADMVDWDSTFPKVVSDID